MRRNAVKTAMEVLHDRKTQSSATSMLTSPPHGGRENLRPQGALI